MIKFEILESLNFRGGNHFCDFYAEKPDDVTRALKDAWYQSGIAGQSGELFLIAYPTDSEGNETELFFGNCNFDEDGSLCFNFVDLSTEEDYEPWYSCGVFSVGGVESLEDVLKALLDFYSPDRVLGSYIFKVFLLFDTLTEADKLNFDLHLFANILDFGQSQGKLHELSDWLFSKQGLNSIDGFAYSIDMSSPEILDLSKAITDENLKVFIEKYKKDFGVSIYLPSTHRS